MSATDSFRTFGKERPGRTVEATAVGGLFLDQGVLAEAGLSKDVAVRAGLSVRAGGEPLLADAFPGIAVTLARYC